MAVDERDQSTPSGGVGSDEPHHSSTLDSIDSHDVMFTSAIDGLLERVRLEGEPVLYEASAVEAVLAVQREDPARFERLRAAFKRLKVGVRRWEKHLDAAQRARDQALRASRHKNTESARRGSGANSTGATTPNHEARTDDAHAAHYGEVSTDDDTGITYGRRLGRIWMERRTRNGTERITLAHFSVVIRESVHEVDAPDAEERVIFVLEIVLDGETTSHRREVRAVEFDVMRWPGDIASGAAVGSAPGTRERLAEAIRLMSRGITKRTSLVRYTGWDFGRRVYLTAGTSIDAKGDVDGVRVEPSTPADSYAFPSIRDPAEVRAGVAALVELLAMEPASVVVPLGALAARSVLGPSRSIVHLMGRQGLGKSTLAALIAMCFGPSMVKERAPLAWDRITPIAAMHALATIGHAVVPIEDLRAEHLHKADPVLRAVFNGAAGMKGKREGGVRHEPRPRSSVLSTGEVRLPGASLNSRVLTLSLDTHPMPRPDASGGIYDRASNGDLARGMAAFVSWLAPRAERDISRLLHRERIAAREWRLDLSARAEEVLGAFALGLDELFGFFEHVGVMDALALAAARRRAAEALRHVAREHEQRLAVEDPARRFCELIGTALRSGEAHVAGLSNGDRTIPSPPSAWGYRSEPSWDGLSDRPQGRRVGWVDTRGPIREVLIDPSASLTIARELAQRSGYPLSGDSSYLAGALRDAGLLARTAQDSPRKTLTVRVRLGGGTRVEVLAVKVEALGFEIDHTPATDHSSSSRSDRGEYVV